MITNTELAKKSLDLLKLNTVYASGMLIVPITEEIIAAKSKQFPNKYPSEKQATLRKLIGKNYFGTDCVCMIKGLIRGFPREQVTALCPDYTTEQMIEDCTEVSEDFTNVTIGEIVWIKGHVGLVAEIIKGVPYTVECTTNIYNKVVKKPLSARKWVKHGKLSKYVQYPKETTYSDKQFKQDLTIVLKLPKGSTPVQILEKTPELKIKQDNQSTVVKIIQKRLAELKYLDKKYITGIYDLNTVKAVKTYQKNNTAENNSKLVDGVMSAKGKMWKHILGVI